VRSLLRISAGSLVIGLASLVALQFFVATEDGSEPALAGSGATLSLDMDISDGACTDIDAARTVGPFDSFEFAVCLSNPGTTPIAAFNYHVLYDDMAIGIPEVADSSPGLDDNPDANAGATVFSTPSLGGGWSCDGGVGAYPNGDMDGEQNGDGKAFSGGCSSAAGPNSLLSGPLGVINAHVTTGVSGVYTLTLTEAAVTDDAVQEVGSCNYPGGEVPMPCNGGTLFVGNPDCANPPSLDDEFRPNGPNVPDSDDATWPRSEVGNVSCDLDDDNDLLNDHYEDAGVTQCGYRTLSYDFDSDGDHLHDGWECANGSDARDPLSKFLGSDIGDSDGDRVPGLWEQRGYEGNPDGTDSDGDGCSDLVEIASVDGNRAIGDADRLSVARRALNIWGPDSDQDWVLDISANGSVDDPDRLFVARAALLPDWQPKLCP
jgi:hypothetical protein